MILKLQMHSIDFVQDQATIALHGEGGTHVVVKVKLPTPENQTEEQLKAASLAAAKEMLQEALNIL
ncbi:hypothetical protein [Paracoccus pantotrophus]|uniref:hypothetical protein n=1 Tax=Paracoccus pantotrophus TaxID=82367 RepID=UPI0004B009AE|nr:hypothetical protein [Paracoccus pantotrophus]